MQKTITRRRWQGMGDAVEAAATVTGVKAVVEKVAKATGRDCGCNKRREALNKLVPFKKEAGDALQSDAD